MFNTLHSHKNINRAIIADGKLLQHYIFNAVSANDELLLANINEIYTYVETTYTAVHDNSATNWNNSKVSGFSAFNFNTTAQNGTPYIGSTLAFSSTHYITTTVLPANKTLQIAADFDELAKSYYARSMAQGGYVDENSVTFNNCSATNHSFVFSKNSSANNHGIIFARNASTANDFGLVYALGYEPGYSMGIAEHSSCAFYGSTAYGKSNICFYRSQTDADSVSSLLLYNSTGTSAKYCIAKHNSLVTGINNIAEYNSTAKDESVAFYDASAVNRSIALYDSCTTDRSIAFMNSTALHMSVAYNNSIAEDLSVALKHANAKTNSIALMSGTADTYSVSIGKLATATNYSMAFTNATNVTHPIIADTSSFSINCQTAVNCSFGMCFGQASNTSFSIHSIANASSIGISRASAFDSSVAILTGSYAQEHSVSMLKSQATDYSLAYNNSNATVSSIAMQEGNAHDCSIAMFNSTASFSSIAYHHSSAVDTAIAFNNSIASDCSIALFGSTASHSALALYENTIVIDNNGSINGLLLTIDNNGEIYVND